MHQRNKNKKRHTHKKKTIQHHCNDEDATLNVLHITNNRQHAQQQTHTPDKHRQHTQTQHII